MSTLFAHYNDVPKLAWPCEFFTPKEIACRGTGELLVNNAALVALDQLRRVVDEPLVVSSAYRSAIHNARVGGEPLSCHRLGIAFDIVLTFERDKLLDAARALGFNGFGAYKTFTHIDMGRKRRWNA